MVFGSWIVCNAQSIQLYYTFPHSFWNQPTVVGNSSHLLGTMISHIPHFVFEKEHTGFENTTNSLYRTTILAGAILPLSSILLHGNSAIAYTIQNSNSEFSFTNPIQFWNNTITVSSISSQVKNVELEENFHTANGYNQAIFLRNAITKNVLHSRKTSIFESAVLVSSIIAQLRPFVNEQTFAGSSEYKLSTRFHNNDSTKALTQRKIFQSVSSINLLNPILWTALYHTIFSYPIKGKSTQQTPFIRLTRTVTYLPYFDVLLAPYGPEVRLSNVFTNQNNLQTAISFRLSSTENDNPFSIGFEVWDYQFSQNFYGSGGIELWNQPKDFVESTGRLGGQAFVDFTFDVTSFKDNFDVGLSGGLGYKSYGFSSIPTIQESFFVQAGISLRQFP